MRNIRVEGLGTLEWSDGNIKVEEWGKLEWRGGED